jgi:hypothetical protein
VSIASLTASPLPVTGRHRVDKPQGELEFISPIVKLKPYSPEQGNASGVNTAAVEAEDAVADVVVPVLPSLLRSSRSSPHDDAAVLQIWEGTVLDVDMKHQLMRAQLRAKQPGQMEDHVGDIHFEWVTEQDLQLIRPGAVFYLTLYKTRRPGGTLVNSQELRFRRLPAWTQSQLAQVDAMAEAMMKKIKARPVADD